MCGFCSGREELGHEKSLFIYIDVDKGTLEMRHHWKETLCHAELSIKIKYCPFCGGVVNHE